MKKKAHNNEPNGMSCEGLCVQRHSCRGKFIFIMCITALPSITLKQQKKNCVSLYNQGTREYQFQYGIKRSKKKPASMLVPLAS